MNSCAVPQHEIDLDFHSMSDEGLIAAAQSGQEWAFVELCARSSKRTFSSIYSVTRNREDAEDALQDSMLRAFKICGNLTAGRASPPGSPGSASIPRS
jgi:DNA-directed RNA polymerase specialized sigma24 family protein